MLIGILVLLAASNIFLFVKLDRVEAENRNEMANLTKDLKANLEQMRIDSSDAVQRSRKSMEELQARLVEQRRAAALAVGQAKVDAEKKVAMLQESEAAQQQKVDQAITAVKQTADTATTQLATVSTDVGNVKTDVQSTKAQLEQTIANLKKATGELDSHESLIATNRNELKALRELGERNYLEFTIEKSKKPKRVGDVMVELKKVDTKHNKFTIELTADDKTVEKKDRTINEPIQFLTSKATQPDEIVVNQVQKDKIVGYLATPKVQTPRSGS